MSVQLEIHHAGDMYTVVHGTDVLAMRRYGVQGITKFEAEQRCRDYAEGMVQGLELARRLVQGATIKTSVVEIAS